MCTPKTRARQNTKKKALIILVVLFLGDSLGSARDRSPHLRAVAPQHARDETREHEGDTNAVLPTRGYTQ